ncbi:hypothetical protein OAM66_02935 [Pelagibacteraceae bacterium]|nr:hypothetical protein [Pelagibacteraceae bacterium]
MNHGERNEILIKIYLSYLKKDKVITPIFGLIKNLGFANKQYKYLDNQIDLRKLTDKQIESIADKIGIAKSPSQSKADIFINKKGYSLKYLNAARPAIVNHTSRYGWQRIAKEIGEDIKKLDQLIVNYWNLRLSGKIAEDCGNNNLLSPFKNHKDILKPYLEYFCFTGTGSSKSKHEAVGVLKFKIFDDSSTWVLNSKSDEIDKLWDGLYFCMRGGKGMDRYNNPDYKKIMKPWTKFTSKKDRGALHVRYESK